MGTAADIATGIKALIVDELGASFKELSYSIDISKNRFDGGRQGYAVVPGQLEQVEGVTRNVTVDQDFDVCLTESFGQSKTGDQAQVAAASILFGRMEALYRRIVIDKAGAPASVMIVSRLSVLPVEYVDSNTAVLRATVNIRYRTAL